MLVIHLLLVVLCIAFSIRVYVFRVVASLLHLMSYANGLMIASLVQLVL